MYTTLFFTGNIQSKDYEPQGTGFVVIKMQAISSSCFKLISPKICEYINLNGKTTKNINKHTHTHTHAYMAVYTVMKVTEVLLRNNLLAWGERKERGHDKLRKL